MKNIYILYTSSGTMANKIKDIPSKITGNVDHRYCQINAPIDGAIALTSNLLLHDVNLSCGSPQCFNK